MPVAAARPLVRGFAGAHGRAALSRALRSDSGRILFAGAALTALVAGLSIVTTGDQAVVLGDVHRTIAALAALLAGIAGTRSGRGIERAVRGWLTVSMGLWLAGQLVLDISAASAGIAGVFDDGISRALLLATGIPAGIALSISIRPMDAIQRRIAALDATTVFLATAATLLALLGGAASRATSAGDVFALAYPVMVASTTSASLVFTMAMRIEVRPSGAYAAIGGSVLMSAAALGWLLSPGARGTPFAALYSLSLLVAGLGLSTWSSRRIDHPLGLRFADWLSTIVPFAASLLMALVIVTRAFATDQALTLPILLTAAAACVVTAIRQSILLSERGGMVTQLAAAQGELREMLGDRTDAESRQRNRARLLADVLEASEGLVAGHDPSTYTRVLELIVPAGCQGSIALDDEVGGGAEIVASVGPFAPLLVGRRIDPRAFAAEQDGSLDRGHLNTTILQGQDQEAIAAGIPPEALLPPGSGRITVPLMRPDGHKSGVLVILDPTNERISDPTFVDLARLVGNQLAVAVENNHLLTELEAKLEETQRMQIGLVHASKMTAIGQLAGAVAHEVNNPLAGVLGYAELLLASLPGDDPSRPDLEVIRSEALRARGIVRGLMEFAQSRIAQRVESDLNETVGSTVGLMRYHLMRGGIVMSESYEEMPAVECDPAAIRQVVVNVCNNAVEAMPEGGTISIETHRRADAVVIRIGDTGHGMTPAVQARIFEPFYTTRMQSGGGLGLPVALAIVESHGGTIEVESTVGVGTWVEIVLPLVAEQSVTKPGARRGRLTTEAPHSHAPGDVGGPEATGAPRSTTTPAPDSANGAVAGAMASAR